MQECPHTQDENSIHMQREIKLWKNINCNSILPTIIDWCVIVLTVSGCVLCVVAEKRFILWMGWWWWRKQNQRISLVINNLNVPKTRTLSTLTLSVSNVECAGTGDVPSAAFADVPILALITDPVPRYQIGNRTVIDVKTRNGTERSVHRA